MTSGRTAGSTSGFVGDVRIEHVREPLGIGVTRPRLSWSVAGVRGGWRQAAYEIEVSDPTTGVARQWSVDGPEATLVPWPAPALASRDVRGVRVRARGEDGETTTWSEPILVEAGLLDPADWSARFIGPQQRPDPDADGGAPLLRGEFSTRPQPIRRARVYASALGLFELELNGERVGNLAMTPGWTSYRHRLRYLTLDVTEYLRAGPNAIGAWLADGWYRGRLGFGGGIRNIYGDQTALLAQVEIEYEDGSRQTVGTSTEWRSSSSAVVSSGIYDGERYDARLEQTGWSSPGFDASAWSGTVEVDYDRSTLFAPLGPSVREAMTLPVAAVVVTDEDRVILDFGQNLVGRVRIAVKGARGETVTIRHAEVLDADELCVRPLRHAACTDTYTLAGAAAGEEWEPRFTYHGFRFVEIRGWPQAAGSIADSVSARVYFSDMEPTGEFECSNDLVNQLHANIVWSMRGNFLDVPTDCPQRDERLGWTGDVLVFAPTASYLYDCAGVLTSWLQDLAVDQFEDGTVPFFIPSIPAVRWWPPYPAAVWGDASVSVPWTLYEQFGDDQVVRDQYASARAWVDLVERLAGPSRLWDTGKQLGDWLDPIAPPDDPAAGATDRYLIATAYFARSSRLLSEMARVLDDEPEAKKYLALSREVEAAFRARWVEPSGRMRNETTTAYAIAITLRLLESEQQYATAGRRLAELVRASGHRIATGFVGTPIICDALTEAGYLEDAYALLLQPECPSWLYPLSQGATTIWERWDSLRPDGSVNPGQMTSFNHYALGAVGSWLHGTVGGLAAAEPGYRSVLVRPRPGGGITHARTRHVTPLGPVEVRWQTDGENLDVDLETPAGVRARVDLPGHDAFDVGSGTHSWRVTSDGVHDRGADVAPRAGAR